MRASFNRPSQLRLSSTRFADVFRGCVTLTAQHALSPFIQSISTLEQCSDAETLSQMKKGCSKKAKTTLDSIETCIDNLTRRIEILFDEKRQVLSTNLELQSEISSAAEGVRAAGADFLRAVSLMCNYPLSTETRVSVASTGRTLVLAVSHLLNIADSLDLEELKFIHTILRERAQLLLQNANSQAVFNQHFNEITEAWQRCDMLAAARTAELSDMRSKDELTASRVDVRRSLELMLASGKAYLCHSDIKETVQSMEAAYTAMNNALIRMSVAATGNISQRPANQTPQFRSSPPGIGDLETDVEEFREQISIDPLTYDEVRMRPFFEARLESVISGAAHIADSQSTREEHRQQIVNECNMLRQALQDILREYALSIASGRPSEAISRCMDNLDLKMSNLRVFLRRAVTDNVSDCFLDPAAPLLALISAAQQGDESVTERYIAMFNEHAAQMLSVSRMSCAISSDDATIRAVSMSTSQILDLAQLMPAVSRLVTLRPQSQQALDCAETYKDAWLEFVYVLLGGIDALTAIDDFFLICEDHILEDVNKCVACLQQGDPAGFEQNVALVRARVLRLCQRLNAYADSLPPGDPLADRLRAAAGQLHDVALPTFLQIASSTMKALASGQLDQLDENAVVDSARQLYESSADACRILGPPIDAVQGGQTQLQTSDSMVDMALDQASQSNRNISSRASSQLTPESQDDIVKEAAVARESATNLMGPSEREQIVEAWSTEQREQIREQIEYFRQERVKFNKEVGKWDETGNELIQLAKQMCIIMQEMTDFTRNRGPLRTVMDVIQAARRISDLGHGLNKLAVSVGDQCPDSLTKKDLFAYLDRVTLHCHQLSICSKVKADVENISGELAAHHSLESATSLIQAARNLMEAVVLTVKSCYVASTKYSRLTGSRPVIQWRMKPPTKKPIFQPQSNNQQNMNGRVKAVHLPPMAPATKPRIKPADALQEFDHGAVS